MPTGFGLETAASIEVIAAYAAPQTLVPAVNATPGWRVLGAFYLPKTVVARLDAMMMVSDDSLTCRVRLYDATPGAMTPSARVIQGTVSTQSTTSVRALGPKVTLTGGHLYQIQCEVTGDEGDEFFGVVPTATITD
jgi:hypothetical protein